MDVDMNEANCTNDGINANSTEETKEFDETLISCNICFEILLAPVNLAPCNHKFCSACMYRWLDSNHCCPKCRVVVREVTKDGIFSQICDEYLKMHPEKMRTKESLEDMNKAELEFLEKLLERANTHQNRRIMYPLCDEAEMEAIEEDQLRTSSGKALKRVFFNIRNRFRLTEWRLRSKRLREILKLPAHPYPDTEEENSDEEEGFIGGAPIQARGAYPGYAIFDYDDETDEEDLSDEEGPNETIRPVRVRGATRRVLPRWNRSPPAPNPPNRRSTRRGTSRIGLINNNRATRAAQPPPARRQGARVMNPRRNPRRAAQIDRTQQNTRYNLRNRRSAP